MKPKLAAFWITIVVAILAILSRTSFVTSVRNWCSCEELKQQVDRSCAWERHQCADDCVRYNLFLDNGRPITADAYRNATYSPYEDQTRRSVLYRVGARVACWPSTGGMYIKHALPVEMNFLGLSARQDTRRPSESDPDEEDAFCKKMRLIGAEFWQVPPDLTTCASLEECVGPQIRSDLGVSWRYQDERSGGGAHMVNLTDAKIRMNLGPGMRGYFQATDMESRIAISYSLGGVWCPDEPLLCEKLWCAQYPSNCGESRHLMNDHILYDCEKRQRGFF